MAETLRLNITEMVVGQSGGEVLFNEAMQAIDATVMLSVLDIETGSGLGGETGGEIYLVSDGGTTGDFAGKDNQIAYYDNGWNFIVPEEGMTAYLQDEDCFVKFDGTDWVGNTQVADLNQDISATYVEAEVQAISDKVDELLAVLRLQGVVKP